MFNNLSQQRQTYDAFDIRCFKKYTLQDHKLKRKMRQWFFINYPMIHLLRGFSCPS